MDQASNGNRAPELIDELKRLGIRVSRLSLNVGIPYPLLRRKLQGVSPWEEGEEDRVREAIYHPTRPN